MFLSEAASMGWNLKMIFACANPLIIDDTVTLWEFMNIQYMWRYK